MKVTSAPKSSAQQKAESLLARLGQQYGVEPAKFYQTLVNLVFRQYDGSVPSNEELLVVMLMCEQYGLNPFAREIYAIKTKAGAILPMISVDGWMRIVHRQPTFDGISFKTSETKVMVNGRELPEAIECSIAVKGKSQPVRIVEYMEECFMPKSGPWNSHPRRMLRHRAFIQCARMAFGLTGMADSDDMNGFESGYAAEAIQAEAAIGNISAAPAIGIERPAYPDATAPQLASTPEPAPVSTEVTASTIELQKRFNTLMEARKKTPDAKDFWERAKRSVQRRSLPPQEEAWMLAKLEEERKAEEQAQAQSEPEPEQPAAEPVEVKEPPAKSAKAAKQKEPEPEPSDDIDDLMV